MKHYNIPIFIPHLGCPFNCIFCNQKRIASQQHVPSPDDVVNTISHCLDTISKTSGMIEVAFFGGNFTAIDRKIQEKYLQAVNYFLKTGKVNSIRISTRPDYIDEGILRFLDEWGVKTIELGVQSLSDIVLKKSKRGYEEKDVIKACYLVKENNFKLGIQLMIGLPGDSYSADMETAAKVTALKPDMVRIYPTLVIEDTYLAAMFRKGVYKPLSLREAVKISKGMFLKFQEAGIDVIRMGLQPSKDLCSPGTVIAGPFHPSFGELVEQEVFKDQAQELIKRFFRSSGVHRNLRIFVHEKDISKMIGHKRANVVYLRDVLALENISICANQFIKRDCIGVGNCKALVPQEVLTREEFCREFAY